MDAKKAAAEILRRRRARSSMINYAQYIKDGYIVSNFAQIICGALDQFLIDLENGLRPVLVIKAPPQHGKSELVSRMLPSYALGKYPNLSIAGLSYGKSLASDMNRDVQKIMTSYEYGCLFPDSTLNKKRVVTIENQPKRNSEVFELTGRVNGRYISQGVGGPLTGKRVDLGVIDDPIKNSKEALSETVKEGVWNWYVSTFLTRLSKDSGQIIMATSWADDDLMHRVIATNPRAKVLSFQAINDDENALIPELHPLEKLLEYKATMSEYFWNALYQQRPMKLGGNLIKIDRFKYYLVKPKIKYKNIYADTAQKTKEHNDYSVFQCWGLGEDQRIYLLDQIRGKWEAPELEKVCVAFFTKHKSDTSSQLRYLKIEDAASGTGLIQTIQRNGTIAIPVEPIKRTKDKYTRLMDVLGYIEAGRVVLDENATYLSDLLTECAAFSANNSHKNDDQIDPMIDAIFDMLLNLDNDGLVWLQLKDRFDGRQK
jgi:predicted phage terminase large subunit-like protein